MLVIFIDKEWNPSGSLLSDKRDNEIPGCQRGLA